MKIKNMFKRVSVITVLSMSLLGSSVAFGESLDTVDIGTMISDKGNWKVRDTFSVESDKVVVGKLGDAFGMGGYKEQTDRLITLQASMKFTVNDNKTDDSFIYFGVRDADPVIPFNEGGSFYGFFVNALGGVSVLEWVSGALIGKPVDSAKSPLADGKFHTIQYGAIDTKAGTRLVFNVDGKTIIDFVDEGKKKEAGYYSFYVVPGNELVLKAAGDAAPAVPAQSSGGASQTDGGAAANPKTGDTGVAMYAVIAAAAGLALLGTVVWRRRNAQQR